jgi:hypothetical protein
LTAVQCRHWLLIALMLAVPFQALAVLMPSWLPHSHPASSVAVPAHVHTMHLHPDGVKVHSVVVADSHDAAADHNGALLGESSGDWSVVYALPAVLPVLVHVPNAEKHGRVLFLLPPHTPDLPQRPPRA